MQHGLGTNLQPKHCEVEHLLDYRFIAPTLRFLPIMRVGPPMTALQESDTPADEGLNRASVRSSRHGCLCADELP